MPYLLAAKTLEISDPQNKSVLSTPIPPLEQLVEGAVDRLQAARDGKAAGLLMPKTKTLSELSGQQVPEQKENPFPIPTPVVFALLGLGVAVVLWITYRMLRKISRTAPPGNKDDKTL